MTFVTTLADGVAAALALLLFDIFSWAFHWDSHAQLGFVFFYLLFQIFRTQSTAVKR